VKSVLLLLAISFVLPAADRPRVTRDELAAVEKSMDGAIRSWDVVEPYDVLGFTRGVYLPGYGVVFTTEVNLVITLVTPFSPVPTGQKLLLLKDKKQKRLAHLRNWMRETLVTAGASLDQVPQGEKIVYAMTLFYQGFEDHSGMPNQVVLEAPRQALIDFKAGRIGQAQLDAAIQAWEL
jgi:hypothetical protein